jgi:hypothetical protein
MIQRPHCCLLPSSTGPVPSAILSGGAMASNGDLGFPVNQTPRDEVLHNAGPWLE